MCEYTVCTDDLVYFEFPLSHMYSGQSAPLDGTLKDILKITQGSTRCNIVETEDIPLFDGGADPGYFSTDTFCWNETRFDKSQDAIFPAGSVRSGFAMTEGVCRGWQPSGEAGMGAMLDVRAGCLWMIFVDSALGANFLYGRAAFQYKFRDTFVFDAVLIPAGSKMYVAFPSDSYCVSEYVCLQCFRAERSLRYIRSCGQRCP